MEIYKLKGKNSAEKFATDMTYKNTKFIKDKADELYSELAIYISSQAESKPFKKPFEKK
ncbi:hypothetical protein [Caviibacter abscessus]|nr:hypothetical protein [Caviibacter abscessus]